MGGHEKTDDRAGRLATDALRMLGREIRLARLSHDLSQETAGRAMRVSRASWGRIERGEAPSLALADLGRALAVVGLELHVRAYPRGQPIRDHAHLALLERLRASLGPDAAWATEVPLPAPGDRRAWDALIRVAKVRIGVEAETRARDAQELQRRLMLKQRDGGVDHVIMLLCDTRHNRSFLRAAGAGFLTAFPIDGRLAAERLAASVDPGGSAIILL